jgi:sigma-B regulation protein RsbU (phosphoserine phosphatase)
MLTAQMLRLRGYQTIEATDGASALATWRRGGVQALITDLDMPGMQGHELIRTLRDEEGTAHTRIIVCSGSPVPARQQPVLHDAYLLKPLNIETLVGALQDLGLRA